MSTTREIAIGALVFVLLISLGAHLWQMGQAQDLANTLQQVNSSYQQDQKKWDNERYGLLGNITTRDTRIADLQLTVDGLNRRLGQTQGSLADKTRELEQTEQKLEQSEGEVSRRESELSDQQGRLQNLSIEFTRLQSSLNSSMAWFKDNSKLPIETNPDARTLAMRIEEDCVDANDLNLACIDYELERTATISYRTDKDNASRSIDHLQSIEETFRTWAGDCEDYALLLKASLNTLRDRGDYRLVAWENGGNDEFRVFPKEGVGEAEKYWYYPDARPRPIGNLSVDPVWVVCFPSSSGGGHCTVAVGGRRPGIGEDAPDLAGARVFEPQNGGYLGTVGEEFALCRPQTQDDCWSTIRSIIIVIGDDDMYEVQSAQWNGYGNLYRKIESEKNASVCPTCGKYT